MSELSIAHTQVQCQTALGVLGAFAWSRSARLVARRDLPTGGLLRRLAASRKVVRTVSYPLDPATARAWRRWYAAQCPKLQKRSDKHQDRRGGQNERAQPERKKVDLESGEQRHQGQDQQSNG